MLNNSTFCIEILRTFERKELENFKDFISCRYFNTDKYVIRLLEILDRKKILGKRIFDTDMRDIVRRELFEKRPIAKASETKKLKKEKALFNAKMNLLQKLAENFLAIQTMEHNEAHKYELLYHELLDRKLFRLFERHANKNRKLLRKQIIKDQEDYGQSYRTERKFYDFLALNDRFYVKDNLSKMMHDLDIYYILNNLHIRLSALALKQTVEKKDYNFPSMEIIETLIKYPEYSKHPLIRLYVASIELKKSMSQKSYDYLLYTLDEVSSVVPTEILKDCYSTCIAHCIHGIISGDKDRDHRKNMLDLYRTMHNKNLMLDEGIILPYQLKNMVVIACKKEQFGWAKDITEYYYSYVRKPIRESVYNFNIGIIAFNQKKFDIAHDKFLKVRDIDLTYDINVRVLILKCYYEKARLLKESKRHYNEQIMGTIRNAKTYFKNKKELTSNSKKSYENFAQILIYLYRILHGVGKIILESVKERLDKQEVNADKQWLREKLAELEKRK